MKFNWKTPLITGALLANSLLGYSQDTSKTDKKFSFVDSVMAESKKFPTTTHFLYEIMKDSEYNFHDINKLEKIIGNVEERFEKQEKYSQKDAIKILEATGEEIKNIGLKYEKNKFDCDDISFVYLAVGEKFGLPLYGIHYPGHFFIRYDLDGKNDPINLNNSVNKEDFNWDAVSGTKIKKIKISKESIPKDVYLKSLTKQELIASAFFNNGGYFGLKRDYDLSVNNSSKAIALNPSFADAYRNRAIAYIQMGKEKEADRDSEKYLILTNKERFVKINPKEIKKNKKLGITMAKKQCLGK